MIGELESRGTMVPLGRHPGQGWEVRTHRSSRVSLDEPMRSGTSSSTESGSSPGASAYRRALLIAVQAGPAPKGRQLRVIQCQ